MPLRIIILTKNFKPGALGLWKVGVVFIDLWYHMKLRKPSPSVGEPIEKNYLPEGIKKPAVVPPGYLGGSMCEMLLEILGFCQVTKGGYQRQGMVP